MNRTIDASPSRARMRALNLWGRAASSSIEFCMPKALKRTLTGASFFFYSTAMFSSPRNVTDARTPSSHSLFLSPTPTYFSRPHSLRPPSLSSSSQTIALLAGSGCRTGTPPSKQSVIGCTHPGHSISLFGCKEVTTSCKFARSTRLGIKIQ